MNFNLSKTKNSRDELIKKINYYFLKEKETLKNSYRIKLLKESLEFFIKTDDGSYTLNSPDFNGKIETMHNSNGAITESFEKFIKPFKHSYVNNNHNILSSKNELSNDVHEIEYNEKNNVYDLGYNEKNDGRDLDYNKNIAILDICSGLGYNSAAAIEDFLNTNTKNNKVNFSIDMVEISIETLAAGLVIPSPINGHMIVKKAIESKLIEENRLKLNLIGSEIPKNIDISIHCEDARRTVKKLTSNSYDAIFLDPYSPAMAPELCTVEFFKELKRIIKDDGIIATYTLAAGVRYAFVEAGFYIGEGPIFGRRSGGTIASLNLNNINKDISHDDEKTIALSDAGIPFRDLNLDLKAHEILENRKIERKHARHNYKISSAVQTPIFVGKKLNDEKLKRRLLRNLNKVNISDLRSKEAIFLISPQYEYIDEILSSYDESNDEFGSKDNFKNFNSQYNFKRPNSKNIFKKTLNDKFKNVFNFYIKNSYKSNFKSLLNPHYKSNSRDRIVEMDKRLKLINYFYR